MSGHSGSRIHCDQVIPTLAVGDVVEGLRWYTEVAGFTEAWRHGDPPGHAAVMLGKAEVHLSASEPDPGSNWLYFPVEDVDDYYERLLAAGADVVHGPQDQDYGMREIVVRDHRGNGLCFGSYIMAREPKLEIRRETVEVELERRLLALLRDLAAHKGMTLTELFEETFLHTFEPLEDGVASPHTRGQLARIAELKERHGIDYDCHASYRFVETDGP